MKDILKIVKTNSLYTKFVLLTENDFIKTNEVIVQVTDTKISITKPTLDYTGKTKHPIPHNKSNTYQVFSSDPRLIPGKYQIEQENEDELIIYYNEED